MGAILLALALVQTPDYVAQGVQALDAHQPAEAEQLFRKAVAADPGEIQPQFDLALVLGMQGKDPEAIAAYRRVLTLKPGLYDAEVNLGILLLRDKHPDDAAVVLRDAVDQKPAEFRPQLLCAEALFDSGDFEGAERYFRAAVGIDGKSAVANLGLARALLQQSKLDDSAEYYRMAAALDPAARNALLELGAAYDKADRSSDAITIFKEFPGSEAAVKRLNQLLLQSNNATAAIPGLEAAVRRSPTTENRLTLADVYRQAGQKEKVLEQLQLATVADGSNFELRMAFGRTLRDGRRFAEASREFQAASTLRPDSVAALNELAGVLILAEKYEDGLAALDRVRVLGKEIPGDYYLRAITLDKLHRKQPALEAYRQFLAAAGGKFPDDEFRARQRARIIERELAK